MKLSILPTLCILGMLLFFVFGIQANNILFHHLAGSLSLILGVMALKFSGREMLIRNKEDKKNPINNLHENKTKYLHSLKRKRQRA